MELHTLCISILCVYLMSIFIGTLPFPVAVMRWLCQEWYVLMENKVNAPESKDDEDGSNEDDSSEDDDAFLAEIITKTRAQDQHHKNRQHAKGEEEDDEESPFVDADDMK